MIPAFGGLSKPSDWTPDKQTLFLVPISDFDCDVPSVGLNHETSIRLLTDDEKERIRGRHFLSPHEWAVDVRPQGPDFDVLARQARDKIDHVITALRLLQAGRVSLSSLDSLVYQPDLPIPPADENRQTFASYLLKKEQLTMLKEVFDRLQIDLEPEVKIALGRFTSSYDRPKYLPFDLPDNSPGTADSLIDLWVALEALFSPSDGELRYRIALRVAYYIGSPEEREEIYLTLVDSYDLRSQVVHGRTLEVGTTKKLKLDPSEALRRTEDYLRRALRNIILSRNPFKPDDLDKVIARGG